MRPIRVLVVDDSSVVRWLVSNALAGEPDIEIVGLASNGEMALEMARRTVPDVVTLDVQMPVLDGLQTLQRLHAESPKLPVIMFSSLTQSGAATTIEALLRGAADYVVKPSKTDGVETALEQMRAVLVPKIVALGRGRSGPPAAARSEEPRSVDTPRSIAPRRGRSARIVVIAASTGGPNALAALVPQLPDDLAVPVVIVQHMPAMFTRLLRDRLAAVARVEVAESYDDAPLTRGQLWIAPGGVHTEIVANAAGDPVLRLVAGPEENFCRPSADVLFRSAARVFGEGALAVVLTGMGHDGLRGCEAIVQAGGSVIAQDEFSSVVWGMPGAVVREGLARLVLPLDGIAGSVARRVIEGGPPRTAARGGAR